MIITGWAFSEHAQALMISTRVSLPFVAPCHTASSLPLSLQVHAIFGTTLMLAGLARIIEVSFIVPKYYPLPETDGMANDGDSEHTLADAQSPSGNSVLWKSVKSFRHLPPFVSSSQPPF